MVYTAEAEIHARLKAAHNTRKRVRRLVQAPLLVLGGMMIAPAIAVLLISPRFAREFSASDGAGLAVIWMHLALYANFVLGFSALWLMASAVMPCDRVLPYGMAAAVSIFVLALAALDLMLATGGAVDMDAWLTAGSGAPLTLPMLDTIRSAAAAIIALVAVALTFVLAGCRGRPSGTRRATLRAVRGVCAGIGLTRLAAAVLMLVFDAEPLEPMPLGAIHLVRGAAELAFALLVPTEPNSWLVAHRLARRARVSLRAITLVALAPKPPPADEPEPFALRGVSLASLQKRHLDPRRASTQLGGVVGGPPLEPKGGSGRRNSPAGRKNSASILKDVRFGEVDAYVSHSSHDDLDSKWRALQAWRTSFRAKTGREPVVWLDQVCVEQGQPIGEALAHLPERIGGCRSVLVLLGPSFTGRLWTLVEMLTALELDFSAADIEVCELPGGGDAVEQLAVDKAECTLVKHRDHLRSCLEAAAAGECAVLESRVRVALNDARSRKNSAVTVQVEQSPHARQHSAVRQPSKAELARSASAAPAEDDPPADTLSELKLTLADESSGPHDAAPGGGGRDPRISYYGVDKADSIAGLSA